MDLDRLTPSESRRFWNGEWLTPSEEDEMDQLSMLEGNTSKVPPEEAFDGETYAPPLDYERLNTALGKVARTMADGRWYTLSFLAQAAGCSEAAASARLRDLRKSKYGRNTIERRRLGGGLWTYRWVR